MVDDNIVFFKTELCLVRSFTEIDLDIFMEYRNDKEWMKYQGFKGLSKDKYRKSLLAPFCLKRGSQLAIAERSNNLLIGDLYLKKENEIIDIGYTIHPNYSRQGLILEVVSHLIDYLFLNHPKCIIRAEMEMGNIASRNLLIKSGFICLKDNRIGYVCTLKKLEKV